VFKSIRWTLLFWYAIILVAVVAGFGATLYVKMKKAIYREVDGRLTAHAQALAGALEREGGAGFDLELSDEYVKTFSAKSQSAPYYVVWDDRGGVVDRSRPDVDVPPAGVGVRDRGRYREVTVASPKGATVLVGQRVSRARHSLREFMGAIAFAGAAALAVALAGGWLLAGRALRPVRKISEAAAEISASNLSRRIDAEKAESELGKLARTLNQTFDRLEQAFERQARFTADASHELRTPLAVVLTQSELALRRERTAAEYREALEVSLKAAQRMKAVVEGLLTLARADAAQANLKRERVDFRKVVEETLAMLGPLAAERKVSLAVSAEAAEVEGDRDRLREAVTNLVTNAIRYNREGGRVEVTLRREIDQAVLAVADTGIGIPEADRPHIFERFYRVDRARSREAGGSGLGLSITKWIVEAHGGVLSFTSREGEGTTFVLRLPAR
jgi:heavy metal sensor kinase